jgi:hypothetical protein
MSRQNPCGRHEANNMEATRKEDTMFSFRVAAAIAPQAQPTNSPPPWRIRTRTRKTETRILPRRSRPRRKNLSLFRLPRYSRAHYQPQVSPPRKYCRFLTLIVDPSKRNWTRWTMDTSRWDHPYNHRENREEIKLVVD